MEPIEFRKTRAHITPTSRQWKLWRAPTRWRQLLEDFRTGGKDPTLRRNMLISLGLHAVVIFGPALFGLFSSVDDYHAPPGGGVNDPLGMKPPETKIRIKTVSQKPRRKFVFRSNSSILFKTPTIFENAVYHDVDKASQLTYTANDESAQDLVQRANETRDGVVPGGVGNSKGNVGKGPGRNPGWDGSENAYVRFIRINHGGPGWDDGMQSNCASDVNLLRSFHTLTGIKVASRTESNTISQLKEYRNGFAPPFVYITGTGAINVSQNDVKVLRDYLFGGGMLFADCGAPAFDASFRSLIAAVLPDKSMVDIADDDAIFQRPFSLPNGAPPIFHHAGTKARGVKHRGRWIVFYHPGDLKDAFRIGHSGLSQNVVREAEQLGTNIICYAFSHYLEATREDRR